MLIKLYYMLFKLQCMLLKLNCLLFKLNCLYLNSHLLGNQRPCSGKQIAGFRMESLDWKNVLLKHYFSNIK